jgi:hypothetical protein
LLEDFGYSKDLTAAQIGQTWLNYIIENRTILWWGGMGTSTEHTAFQRLKCGVPAPRSGSLELNGKAVAEQIGAQIFIDGWGLVAPGDPELAADLARRAGSVSHDGEAVFGAQVVAAMVSQAFVEPDLGRLFETALRFIPKDCTIRRVIDDLRGWRSEESDWRKARERIAGKYGYDKYAGGCHMIPNHALIVLGLLYGEDDFQKSLLIANTAGWDTDCNSGNVGCILGVKNGLSGIDAGPDWRGPVADRLYLPTADGGRCMTDAVQETYALVRAGRALAGEPAAAPKAGARFHFELPGSVQGFRVEDSPECRGVGTLCNVSGHSRLGRRSLAIGYAHLAPGRPLRVFRETFLSAEAAKMQGYSIVASPTLYPGQTLRAELEADAGCSAPATVRPYLRYFGEKDELLREYGPAANLKPGARASLEWRIPGTRGHPISEAGIEVSGMRRLDGTLYLDLLTWDGVPETTFCRPEGGGTYWQKAWVNAAERAGFTRQERPFSVQSNQEPGLLIQGQREWAGYQVAAAATPHLAAAAGLACCVQGLKRYYALLLVRPNRLQLVKEYYGRKVLAETGFSWEFDQTVELALQTSAGRLTALADGRQVFELEDLDTPLRSGAIALLCEEGRTDFGPVRIRPAQG